VKDHPNLAKCLWCSLVTSRSYLYQHIKSAKHIRNAARFFARKDWNPDSGLESSEVADGMQLLWPFYASFSTTS